MPADTRSQILEVAQALVQERGYNAFSYRDLADAIGIKSASIHYHFPAKRDLGKELVKRYRSAFAEIRSALDGESMSPKEKLRVFADRLVASFRAGHRMCLCGIMAAESSSLPAD